MLNNIVFCIDENYIKQCATTIKSILVHNSSDIKFHFIGINETPLLKDLCKNNCKFYGKPDIGKMRESGRQGYISIASLYRLAIPYLIEEDNVLYLDSDIIVRGNIDKLFNLSFGSKLIAASRDPWELVLQEGVQTSQYYNTGVIVWNIKAIREKWSKDDYWNILNSDRIIKGNHYGDQDIINKLFENNILEFSHIYNFTLHHVKKHKYLVCPIIYHFVGPKKPWALADFRQSPFEIRYVAEWFYYNNLIFNSNKVNPELAKWKDTYFGTGQVLCLWASGPSLNKAPMEILKDPALVHVCVNRSFEKAPKCDYFFCADWRHPTQDYIRNVQSPNKFYGKIDHPQQPEVRIPDWFAKEQGATQYQLDWEHFNIKYDLVHCPIANGYSSVFGAFQFALWLHPKQIYLLGCDCSNSGRFDGSKCGTMEFAVKYWRAFKEFCVHYYPDITITSINPVGLKGIFHDLESK